MPQCFSLEGVWNSVEVLLSRSYIEPHRYSYLSSTDIYTLLGARFSSTISLCIDLKRKTALLILRCAIGWESLSDSSGGVQSRCLGKLLWVPIKTVILRLSQVWIQWLFLILLLLNIILLLNGPVMMKVKLLVFVLIYNIYLYFMLVTHPYAILNLFTVVFIVDVLGNCQYF